jgi:hypothetical protein
MERPILFSTPMVQAILEGRKTMTRRIVKIENIQEISKFDDEYWLKHVKNADGSFSGSCIKCPYGKVGDILYVRETYNSDYSFKDSMNKPFPPGILYRATTPILPFDGDKWKSSMFMPKSAARIFLEITDILVERLNDISEEDSINEGVEVYKKNYVLCGDGTAYKKYDKNGETIAYSQARNSFMSLWKSINGAESWDLNPWVWVVKFKQISK